MEDIKSEKKPMSIRLSASTQERVQKALETYKNPADERRDQQENALIRILDIAESEVVRGTHPELEAPLIAIDETIATLIKQVNGIAVGQDAKISNLKDKLNAAIEEKDQAIDRAREEMAKAKEKSDVADQLMTEAAVSIKNTEEQAKSEIETAQKEAAAQIEKAVGEKEQAIRERDDARTIAEEKSASNNMLLKQMASMEEELASYKEILEKYKTLQTEHTSLIAKMEQDKIQAELALEKAVVAKERELRDAYDDRLRQADKENARLQAMIEQMKSTIS